MPLSAENHPVCNAWNHDADCGFGGDTGGGWWPVRTIWQFHGDEFSRRTSCPVCGADVFFVRHNGGSVWFDELGKPWDKHGCFDDEPVGRGLRSELVALQLSGETPTFGVIIEKITLDTPDSAQLMVRCSDGTVIDRVFRHVTMPVGQLVIVGGRDGKITLSPVQAVPAEAVPQNGRRTDEYAPCQRTRSFRPHSEPLHCVIGSPLK